MKIRKFLSVTASACILVATAHGAAVAVEKPVSQTAANHSLINAAPHEAESSDVSSLSWGFKKSWINYLTRPGNDSETNTSNGADYDGKSFVFPPSPKANFSPDNTDFSFSGGVNFLSHKQPDGSYALDLSIKNPSVHLSAPHSATGTLYLDVTSRDAKSGQMVSYGVIPFADLAGITTEKKDGKQTLNAASVKLTAQAAAAFGGFYQAGTEFDPFSFLLQEKQKQQSPASPTDDPCLSTNNCNVYFVNDFVTTHAKLGMKLPIAGTVIAGDWDGDGVSTLAIRNGEEFLLLSTNNRGYLTSTVRINGIGNEGSVYVADVNGDGKDDIAVRIGATYHIKTDLTWDGPAELTVTYGRPGDETLLGDWDGDGKASLGVRRGNEFFIRNDLKPGYAEYTYHYGRADDKIFIGDWDGNGTDTVSVRRGNVFYVLYTPHSGPADVVIPYGRATDSLVVGDWNADGIDTIAVIRP